jgi:putative SOS response-associated peptidase YedK
LGPTKPLLQNLATWRTDPKATPIITIEANGLVAQLHNRMPAILELATFDAWFDPHQGEKDLHGLLLPAAEGVLDLYPVSGYVNKPGNEGAECIKPEGE